MYPPSCVRHWIHPTKLYSTHSPLRITGRLRRNALLKLLFDGFFPLDFFRVFRSWEGRREFQNVEFFYFFAVFTVIAVLSFRQRDVFINYYTICFFDRMSILCTFSIL